MYPNNCILGIFTMGNRPPNIDRFVRLMSKYLLIRRPHYSIGRFDYVYGCNGTILARYDRANVCFDLTLAGRDFWTVCGPLGDRNEQFPEFLRRISDYRLDYQIREVVRHIIEDRYNDLFWLVQFRDSINQRLQELRRRQIADQRLQELRRRQIVNQGKILVCESMLRICIMGFDNLENDIQLSMSQPSPPCDEIPAQPTHVEIRTQLA